MSAKSDFAQKLLHDLRLRKERVAVAQNSSHSHSISRDAHANPGQIYRGSRQTKTLESVKVGNLDRSSTSNRSFRVEESAGQIVPYATGRVRNSEKVGDLSMALAFAIENGGKFTKMDSSSTNPVLTFLHQFGQRSMDISKMGRRTSIDKYNLPNSQFPSVSHVHINEVSKGIQKLNQILTACSNGLNFDKNSIEVGKELLKGAMDLEESLRMLVNLQEASDRMVRPRRKTRITLLDEDEDDEDIVKIDNQKQLERPRFSFDKPSKNSYSTKEKTKNEIKHRLMALTYPDETPKLHEKQPHNTKNLLSHKRSASCAPDFKILDLKNQSSGTKAGSEKGRISNVIAKLMGLDELPQKEDSKAYSKGSDPKKKQEPVLRKAAGLIGTPGDENRSSLSVDKNMIKKSNMLPVQDAKFVVKPENVHASPRRSNDMVSSGRVRHQEDSSIAVIKDAGSVPSGLPVTNSMMDKQHGQNIQVNQVPGYQVKFQQKQKEQNQTSVKGKITKTIEIKEPILKNDTQPNKPQTSRAPPINIVLQQLTDCKEDNIQTEEKATDSFPLSNEKKALHKDELYQAPKLKKSEGQDEKHQAGKKEQFPSNKTLQARKHKASQVETITSPKPRNGAANLKKKQSSLSQAVLGTKNSAKAKSGIKQVALANHQSSSSTVVIVQSCENNNADQNTYSKEVSSQTEKLTSISQLSKQEMPINLPATDRKGPHTDVLKTETSQRIDELTSGRDEILQGKNNAPLEHLSPTLQDMKLQKNDKSCSTGAEQLTESQAREAKMDNGGFDEPDERMQTLNLKKELSTSCSTTSEKASDNLIGSETPISNENHQDKKLEVLEISVDQKPGEDMPHMSQAMDQFKGIYREVSPNSKLFKDELCKGSSAKYTGKGEVTEISSFIPKDQETTPPLVAQEPLTEAEKHFKQSVMKSQIFLNTAEALFKLNIPISILHATDQNNQDADTKLMLDCGYEIMKRKARRQEPYATISISYIKIRSLDDLIKQLCKDFDTLRSYGGKRNMSDECDAADYLHSMIGNDMHNRNPDVNSMWDFGWTERTTFAFSEKDDVMKDVEKHFINGLIDEITLDLLRIAISV